MVSCGGCRRHVRDSDAVCPFCGAPGALASTGPSALERARTMAGVALTAIVLSACYGTGVTDKPTPTLTTGDTGQTGDTAETTTP